MSLDDIMLPVRAEVLSTASEGLVMPQGATQPPLRVQFIDANDEPVDLSFAASATVQIHHDDETTERRAEVSGPSNGEVTYEWDAADTADKGVLKLRFEIETRRAETLVFPSETPLGVSVRGF